MSSVSTKVLDFWNDRAKFRDAAGTNDLIAKQLEIEAIAQFVESGTRILEVGCGNGITALNLAERFDVAIDGFDFAAEMIKEAQNMAAGKALRGRVNFSVADVRSMQALPPVYDVAYTERVLINLPDWHHQRKAIYDIASAVRPGGRYLMCENSADGLDAINNLRNVVGLKTITPPWHNRYLRDEELKGVANEWLELEDVVYYSSTYYFLSRVVNAAMAAQEGTEPEYDTFVNRLALKLPPIANLGQGRIWVWRRK